MGRLRLIQTGLIACTLFVSSVPAAYCAVLNEQVISQFAQTWEPVTQRLMAIDAEFDPRNGVGLVSQLEQMAAADGPDSARDAAVKPDGYSDFEAWAKMATLIITSAQWAKRPPKSADIESAIAAINANQEQNADEKAALIADLKSAFETTIRQKPDQAEIDAAQSLLPLLESIVWPDQ